MARVTEEKVRWTEGGTKFVGVEGTAGDVRPLRETILAPKLGQTGRSGPGALRRPNP